MYITNDNGLNQPGATTIVVKVGGSLLDFPQLAERLRSFIDSLGTPRVVLVVGGGSSADLVRQREQMNDLDHDRSHWLAIRAMTFNSYLVEALLDDSVVVTSLAQCEAAWLDRRTPVLDPHGFLESDESSGSSVLPHRWTVTSDTIAARVARACSANSLILLKSVSWEPNAGLKAAAEQGIVDAELPREVARSSSLTVRIVNLRAWTAGGG